METQEEVRKAHNEALFRDANESVRAVQEDLGMPDGLMPFLCECNDPQCRTIVRLTTVEYEEIRAEPTRFFLAPGHPSAGKVVAEHSNYTVADKTGIGAEVAVETDPRKE